MLTSMYMTKQQTDQEKGSSSNLVKFLKQRLWEPKIQDKIDMWSNQSDGWEWALGLTHLTFFATYSYEFSQIESIEFVVKKRNQTVVTSQGVTDDDKLWYNRRIYYSHTFQTWIKPDLRWWAFSNSSYPFLRASLDYWLSHTVSAFNL